MKPILNTDFSVGIEEIDKHHQMFFNYISLIEDSININESWFDLFSMLEKLEEYAKIHFAVEEALMNIYAYPDTDKHVLAHRNFAATVQDMKRQSVSSNLSKKTALFMRKWLEDHIKKEDSEYAKFILNGAPIVKAK